MDKGVIIVARSIFCGENYNKVYQMDNYRIKYNHENADSNICVIYCSSSGIYYPNIEEFSKAFIKRENKYEWKNYIVKRAYKYIWIRGINILIEFIKIETKVMKIIRSSGGAYIATILSYVLEAQLSTIFQDFLIY